MTGYYRIFLRSPNCFAALADRCAIRLCDLESDAVAGSRSCQIQHDVDRHLAFAEGFPGCLVVACGFNSLRCSWRDPVSRYSTKTSQRRCFSASGCKDPQVSQSTHFNTDIRLLQLGLRRRFPIKSLHGDGEIPTCPYVWPNGQGDVAKFLNGIENSAIWEKSHGPVYRIWSGMSPEV